MYRGLKKEIARDAAITTLNDLIDRMRIRVASKVSDISRELSKLTIDINPQEFHFYNCNKNNILSNFTMTLDEICLTPATIMLMDANDQLYDVMYKEHPLIRDSKYVESFINSREFYPNYIQHVINIDAGKGDYTIIAYKPYNGALPVITCINQDTIVYYQAHQKYLETKDYGYEKLNKIINDMKIEYNQMVNI